MPKTFTVTTDYHMHSTFSPDGDDSPRLMCQQALDLGLSAIAITEHAEWHPAAGFTGFAQVDDYFRAIEQCRAEFGPRGLSVYSGVELGNPHQFFDEAIQLVETYPFDVVIASLHWLNNENIHLAGCFANRDPYEVFAEYFQQLRRLAIDFHFDILAHFDRILWRAALLGIPFEPRHIEPVIRAAMAALVKYNRCLELNTRFLAMPYHWNEALINTEPIKLAQSFTEIFYFLSMFSVTVIFIGDGQSLAGRHQRNENGGSYPPNPRPYGVIFEGVISKLRHSSGE